MIGENIPKGWRKAKLLEVVDRLSTGPQYERLSCFSTGSVPVVDQSANGYTGYHNDKPGVDASEDAPVITFANHTCAARLHKRPFSVIQNVFPLVAKEGNDTNFIFWLLKGSIQSSFYGGHWPKLVAVDLPIPPLSEQKRIANILNEQTSAIEKAKTATEAQFEAAKSLRAAYIHAIFNSPVAQQWPRKKIADWRNAGYITEVQDGNHGELHPLANEFVNTGVPFVTANCIASGDLDLTKCFFLTPERSKKLRIGFSQGLDVLLSHKGSIGFTAVVPADINEIVLSPQVTYYRLNKDLVDPFFLKLAFEARDFQNQLNSISMQATRAYVGITAQQNLFIKIPSIVEQRQVLGLLNGPLAQEEKIYKHLDEIYKTINKLPNAFLRQAFNGEL